MDIVEIAKDVVMGAGLGYSAWQARKAKNLSEPTGNGFAKTVKATLDRIDQRTERTEQKIDDHVAAHANNDIARNR